MSGIRAAIRYAKAILEIADSKGVASEVSADMTLIATTITGNSELTHFIQNPLIKTDIKKNAVLEVFASVNPVTQSLFHLLLENKRFEILAAIGGPYSTMDIFVEMANGKSFSEAFEAVYKISWASAVPIISNTVSAQIKSNQSVPLSQFVIGKGEIGTYKWPARGYFDEALFN